MSSSKTRKTKHKREGAVREVIDFSDGPFAYAGVIFGDYNT